MSSAANTTVKTCIIAGSAAKTAPPEAIMAAIITAAAAIKPASKMGQLSENHFSIPCFINSHLISALCLGESPSSWSSCVSSPPFVCCCPPASKIIDSIERLESLDSPNITSPLPLVCCISSAITSGESSIFCSTPSTPTLSSVQGAWGISPTSNPGCIESPLALGISIPACWAWAITSGDRGSSRLPPSSSSKAAVSNWGGIALPPSTRLAIPWIISSIWPVMSIWIRVIIPVNRSCSTDNNESKVFAKKSKTALTAFCKKSATAFTAATALLVISSIAFLNFSAISGKAAKATLTMALRISPKASINPTIACRAKSITFITTCLTASKMALMASRKALNKSVTNEVNASQAFLTKSPTFSYQGLSFSASASASFFFASSSALFFSASASCSAFVKCWSASCSALDFSSSIFFLCSLVAFPAWLW